MRVYVRGPNKKVSVKEIKFATQWMSGLIMSDRLRDSLVITVCNYCERGIKGSCEISDYDENPLPRQFLVYIDGRMGRRSQLQTLAHELVHVKQWARGQMRDYKYHTHTRWNKSLVNSDSIDYYDLPWEIEAYGREFGMYRRYIDFLKEQKLYF